MIYDLLFYRAGCQVFLKPIALRGAVELQGYVPSQINLRVSGGNPHTGREEHANSTKSWIALPQNQTRYFLM